MATDLSKLSSQDLQAIASGDMGKVSTEGLQMLAGQAPTAPPKAPPAPQTSIMEDVGTGAKNFGVGLVTGAANVGRGILNLPSYVGLPPIGGKEFIEESRRAGQQLKEGTGFMGSLGEFTSEMAGTAGLGGPIAKGLVAGAGRVLPRALATIPAAAAPGLVGPVGVVARPSVAAALEGGAAGAILGQDWGDVGTGAAAGTLGSKLISKVGSRLASPSTKQSIQAQQLRDMGIDVTTGQGAPGSVLGTIESATRYVPGVGTQRRVPYQQLREKVVAEAMPPTNPFDPSSPKMSPIGTTVDKQLENARSAYTTLYEGAVKGRPFQVTMSHLDDLTNISLDPKYMMSETNRRMVGQYINDNAGVALRQAMNSGRPITGDTLSIIRRNIDDKAAKQTIPEVQAALHEASDKLLELMTRQDPQVGELYTRLAPTYRNLLTAEKAAAGALEQGEFGARQLARAGEQTANPELMDLGRLASTVLRDDSHATGGGTRAALGAAGLLGTGLAGYYGGGPAGGVAAPAVMIAALGTRGGQRALSGQLASQKSLAQLLRENPTLGAVTTSNLANQLTE
jgi:hypothetical protein